MFKDHFISESYFPKILVVFLSLLACLALASLSTIVNGDYGFIESKIYIRAIFCFYSLGMAFYLAKVDASDTKISNHTFRFFIRGVIIGVPVLASFGFTKASIFMFILCGLYFWTAFSPFYNLSKDNKAFYMGKEANHDKLVNWINNKLKLAVLYPVWYIVLQGGLIYWLTILVNKHI